MDALVTAGLPVAAVLGPEHGFRGTAQAGGSEPTGIDDRTGLAVHDIHGADADAIARICADARIETLVVDLQDVGARFYTYIWTLYEAMTAAVRIGLALVVLDRPNPVGGRARGPMLRPGFASPVGGDAITMAHGLTIGELARFFDAECMPARTGDRLGERLSVVDVRLDRCPDLRRHRPAVGAAQPQHAHPGHRPAVSGHRPVRGDEPVGGPRHHPAVRTHRCPLAGPPVGRLVERPPADGVVFREAAFTPAFGTHAGERCVGVQVHITDRHHLDPILVATTMLVGLRAGYREFGWRADEPDDHPDGGWICSPGRPAFVSSWRRGRASRTSSPAGPTSRPGSTAGADPSCSTRGTAGLSPDRATIRTASDTPARLPARRSGGG